MYNCLQICRCLDLKIYVFTGYSKNLGVCCTQPSTTKYSTFYEAKDDCKEDNKCTYIHDPSCNEKEYILCQGGNIVPCSGTGSCVWIKGEHFNFLSFKNKLLKSPRNFSHQ